MTLGELVNRLDLYLGVIVGLIFIYKVILFASTKTDQGPSSFWYNEKYLIHSVSPKPTKKKMHLQNTLTRAFFVSVVLLIAVLFLNWVVK
jgi:hypothetical protein